MTGALSTVTVRWFRSFEAINLMVASQLPVRPMSHYDRLLWALLGARHLELAVIDGVKFLGIHFVNWTFIQTCLSFELAIVDFLPS